MMELSLKASQRDEALTIQIKAALAALDATARRELPMPPPAATAAAEAPATQPEAPDLAVVAAAVVELPRLPMGSPLLEPPGAIQAFEAYAAGVGGALDSPTLVLQTKFGIGNRLLGLVSGFVLAVLTNRRLVVDWRDHPSKLEEVLLVAYRPNYYVLLCISHPFTAELLMDANGRCWMHPRGCSGRMHHRGMRG